MIAGHVNLSERSFFFFFFFNISLGYYLCELKRKESFELILQQHAAENQIMHYLPSSLIK